MRLMGVDPGLAATGYGVVDVKGSGRAVPVEAGTIEPKRSAGLPAKLLKIHRHLGLLIDTHKPDAVVLEKLFTHSKHPTTAAIMAHARGVICLVCAEKGVTLIEESPKRVRKAVTGNGNASKEQTRMVVAHMLKVKAESLSLDASDALALALGVASMGCSWQGRKGS
jgi:crossover junction endodeoxyribonuclease RuvC